MTLQERFTGFYQELALDSLPELGRVYHPEVTFVDPVAVHQGIHALDDYFRKLLNGCSHCRFDIRDQQFEEARGFVNWTMTFASPRLNRGRDVVVDGSSVLGMRDDRVEYQRDYYDMGAMVYEQLPVLAPIIRLIRGRMAA